MPSRITGTLLCVVAISLTRRPRDQQAEEEQATTGSLQQQRRRRKMRKRLAAASMVGRETIATKSPPQTEACSRKRVVVGKLILSG
jgi:hypothetical protein